MKGRLEHLHCVPLRSFSALLFSPFPASLDGALGTGMRCCPLEHPHARASSFPTPTPVSSDRPCHAITASSNRLDVAPISLCTPVLAGHSPGARDDFTDHCRNVLRGVALPPPPRPQHLLLLDLFHNISRCWLLRRDSPAADPAFGRCARTRPIAQRIGASWTLRPGQRFPLPPPPPATSSPVTVHPRGVRIR